MVSGNIWKCNGEFRCRCWRHYLGGNVIITGDILFGKISQSSTTGSYLNTQFGDAQSFQHISSTSSGGSPITGYQNVALGGPTLISITTGSGNLAIGSYSLMSLTTGFQNTGVGCVRFIKLLMVVLILQLVMVHYIH